MWIKAASKHTVKVRFTFNQTPLSMLVFSHRRTKQRIVMMMLAVWLLALLAGVVNACGLQVKVPAHHHGQVPMHSTSTVIEPHAHLSVLPQSAALAPTDDPSSDADAGADADADAEPVNAQCKSFCDVETSAAAAKQQGHDATDLAQTSVHVPGNVPYLPLLATAKQSFDDRPPPPGVPIVIRFLRLTI